MHLESAGSSPARDKAFGHRISRRPFVRQSHFVGPRLLSASCSSTVCTTERTGDESVVVIAGNNSSPRCEGNELAEASDDSD